ncbi:MAG TPA: F0F1 ATP synthase subunit A [Nocardioides sp.]|nr:F0F1 ATP synthase subunit A [Nocardioides sp.]
MSGLLPLEIHIEPGVHPTRDWFGLTVNIDTIFSTVVAGVIVLALGFLVRRALTKNTEDHVPTKLQIIWEAVVDQVNKQVEDNLGKVHPYVAPLAISLFFFILIANWLELVPSEFHIGDTNYHVLPAPTSDTNLTYAMAIFAVVSVWIYGIRKSGLGYFKHFVQPFPVLLPLTVLEELVKPVTLALRLFGNIFAGGIMLALIAAIPWWAGMPVANILWKMFDLFIGGLQAFIFALLTVLYFAMASGGHDDEHEHDAATASAH